MVRSFAAWMVLILVGCSLGGCTASRLASQADQAETLDDINALLTGRIADIHFTDGKLVRRARQVSLTCETIYWRSFGTAREHRRDIREVDRVVFNTRGHASLTGLGLGLIAGLGLGIVVGLASYGDDEGPYAGLGVALVGVAGMGVGAVSGLIIGISREAEAKPIEVYHAPIERYVYEHRAD